MPKVKNNVFNVEKILNKRLNDGRIEYLIKWEGKFASFYENKRLKCTFKRIRHLKQKTNVRLLINFLYLFACPISSKTCDICNQF